LGYQQSIAEAPLFPTTVQPGWRIIVATPVIRSVLGRGVDSSDWL
jgi:hypothetical protein